MSTVNKITARRAALKMTQKQLADTAGVRQSTISMIETGDRTPSLRVIIRIAAALNCTVSDLLDDEQGGQ